MISVDSLTIDYGKEPNHLLAVEKASFNVPDRGSFALIGPSGCGKTSILLALAGLLQPSHGSINVNGLPVVGPRRDIALILQNCGLLPWKTVAQNANLSLLLTGEYPERNVRSILRQLGLAGTESHFPAQLSEGMKRRVAIARALSISPSVMLMDEPLAALDTLTRERIQDLFLSLWRQHNFSLVLVTHDIEEAAFLGQKIIVLTDKPAHIKAVVSNPEMGLPNYRSTDSYANIVKQLRKELEK